MALIGDLFTSMCGVISNQTHLGFDCEQEATFDFMTAAAITTVCTIGSAALHMLGKTYKSPQRMSLWIPKCENGDYDQVFGIIKDFALSNLGNNQTEENVACTSTISELKVQVRQAILEKIRGAGIGVSPLTFNGRCIPATVPKNTLVLECTESDSTSIFIDATSGSIVISAHEPIDALRKILQ